MPNQNYLPYRLKLNDRQETELTRNEWVVYLQAGLIRQSGKSRKFARLNDRFSAYRDCQTKKLLFFVKDSRVDPFAIQSQFRHLLDLLKYLVKYDRQGNPIYEWAYAIHDQVYRAT